MLNLINEELMAYSTITTNEKGKEYTKIKVATSNKLQQYENDTRNNRRDHQQAPIRSRHGNIVSKVDALKSINREIIRISAPLKNIGDFIAQDESSKEINFDLPMSIKVDSTNKYQPHVEVRCHEQGDDRANLYIVAFPFNGMIKPIPENPQYRIYRGLIASSARPFFFNNRKYRKVLYLVIEINKNLFNPEHKYHTDNIDIQLESFALVTDRETGEQKTNCEKFTVSVLSANGDYSLDWEYNTVDEAIMMAVEPGQQLWTTYVMNNQNHRPNTNNVRRENTRNTFDRKPAVETEKKFTNRSNNKQKQVTIEGDMMVTTNKHGIRKEIPMRNNRGYNNRNNGKNDIDRMMQESGMYDTDYEYSRSKKNGGKRNNNNRGKRNNRNNDRDYY